MDSNQIATKSLESQRIAKTNTFTYFYRGPSERNPLETMRARVGGNILAWRSLGPDLGCVEGVYMYIVSYLRYLDNRLDSEDDMI
jgi:hypothetical protein